MVQEALLLLIQAPKHQGKLDNKVSRCAPCFLANKHYRYRRKTLFLLGVIELSYWMASPRTSF